MSKVARRIALGLAYDGSGFAGWQSQASGDTLQDALERALAAIAGIEIRVVAAGRTDAGVHAAAQVVHFDTGVARPESAWVRGVNSHLPSQIAVQWVTTVDAGFHARFSATARCYRYVLMNHPVRPALVSRHAGWFHRALDVAAMRDAGALLVGQHDYSSFRSSECQAKSPVRTIERLDIAQRGPWIFIDITANAFLHHMVRNIVGSLIHIGKGAESVAWMGDLLAQRDRRRAPPTMSAAGLYLTGVRYPQTWQLPAFAPASPCLFME